MLAAALAGWVSVGVLLAGCGQGTGTGSGAASAGGSGTALERANAVICENQDPGDGGAVVASSSPMPSAVYEVWKVGFCEGDPGIRRWQDAGSTSLAGIARQGAAARAALSATPLNCAAVDGTPVEPYCD
jgi:hypothetical protein